MRATISDGDVEDVVGEPGGDEVRTNWLGGPSTFPPS